jgi:DNA-binding transcriptional regulator YbjK
MCSVILMSGRRIQLLDAAIAVLGTRGLRQLTHRTVDEVAGLPIGSTSNHFRTREALIDGVLDRMVELETQMWQGLAGLEPEAGQFAAVVARMVRDLAGQAKTITLARHAIFHEAAFQPGLQRKIGEARKRLAQWGIPWLAALGSANPELHFDTMLALIDGLLSNQLASPVRHFEPEPMILVALRGMGLPTPRGPSAKGRAAKAVRHKAD